MHWSVGHALFYLILRTSTWIQRQNRLFTSSLRKLLPCMETKAGSNQNIICHLILIISPNLAKITCRYSREFKSCRNWFQWFHQMCSSSFKNLAKIGSGIVGETLHRTNWLNILLGIYMYVSMYENEMWPISIKHVHINSANERDFCPLAAWMRAELFRD